MCVVMSIISVLCLGGILLIARSRIESQDETIKGYIEACEIHLNTIRAKNETIAVLKNQMSDAVLKQEERIDVLKHQLETSEISSEQRCKKLAAIHKIIEEFPAS